MIGNDKNEFVNCWDEIREELRSLNLVNGWKKRSRVEEERRKGKRPGPAAH